MESILTSIKKPLGIAEDYTHFDADIIMHINSTFMDLQQLGVGPAEGYYIEDKTNIWSEFLDDPTKLQAVKTYMYLKVKRIFDPPSNSSHMNAMDKQISEYEWRLNVAVDPTQSQ